MSLREVISVSSIIYSLSFLETSFSLLSNVYLVLIRGRGYHMMVNKTNVVKIVKVSTKFYCS